MISTLRQQSIQTIAGVSFLLGLLFDYFFYGHIPGITIFLYTVVILGGLAGLAKLLKHHLSRGAMLIGIAIVFFSAMTFVRASALLTFINIVVTVYLLLLLAKLAKNNQEKLSHWRLQEYLLPISRLPLLFLQKFFDSAPLLVKMASRTKSEQKTSQIVRGLVITVPVLLVFLLLFMSADLVFQKYISSIFSFDINTNWVGHAVLITFIAAGFVGAFAYIFDHFVPETTPFVTPVKQYQLGRIESIMLLGSINVLFLFFILVQFTYLFGGQSNVIGEGITYAEYARKGFFELIAVALFTLVILWLCNQKTMRRSLNHMVQFKVLCLALIIEVAIIMFSAAKRLGLYEQAYGFTSLRFFSHMFIFWLVAAFALQAYQIAADQKEQWFARLIFLTSLTFIVVANLVNPDAFIARQNIQRYKSTGKIDIYYLQALSSDAIPEVTRLLQDPDEDMQKTSSRLLFTTLYNLENRHQNWRSFHLSRQSAQHALAAKRDMLKRHEEFMTPSKFNID